MARTAEAERSTKETRISAKIDIDGSGKHEMDTGIAFFDHMLTLFAVHGLFDLHVRARGDIDVDFHHTVEDTGIVLGDVIGRALGDKKGIVRYGFAATPMDDALCQAVVDLSGRPYLVYDLPAGLYPDSDFSPQLAKEFFRALVNAVGMNLHIRVPYGENTHHITESVFKSVGRAMDLATGYDPRIAGVQSSKGTL
ncbi:MAG: imidazoleglycerol-phosphate dehydratase HisB [Desulfosalsimonas sp.]|uniref:imidazoleglycerol-phosphate dehydratase HisB n=1 Tax=Desulfosalsimonas sp. TaxID=3073848 RepID=UPI0039710D96